MKDTIRPDHYGGEENPLEVIKIIDHYNLNFNTGNAIKYIIRAGVKNPTRHVEDLKKAITYLEFEVKKVEALNPENHEQAK